jgi:hypothetical protein
VPELSVPSFVHLHLVINKCWLPVMGQLIYKYCYMLSNQQLAQVAQVLLDLLSDLTSGSQAQTYLSCMHPCLYLCTACSGLLSTMVTSMLTPSEAGREQVPVTAAAAGACTAGHQQGVSTAMLDTTAGLDVLTYYTQRYAASGDQAV